MNQGKGAENLAYLCLKIQQEEQCCRNHETEFGSVQFLLLGKWVEAAFCLKLPDGYDTADTIFGKSSRDYLLLTQQEYAASILLVQKGRVLKLREISSLFLPWILLLKAVLRQELLHCSQYFMLDTRLA